jgi:hypothetical protein
MKGEARAIIDRFLRRFSEAEQAFLRARFILLTQLDPEQVSPDVDDPHLEQTITAAIETLEREADRINHAGARRSNSVTVKAVKKP